MFCSVAAHQRMSGPKWIDFICSKMLRERSTAMTSHKGPASPGDPWLLWSVFVQTWITQPCYVLRRWIRCSILSSLQLSWVEAVIFGWNQTHAGLKPVSFCLKAIPCYPEISLRVVWNQSHAVWKQSETGLKPVWRRSETSLILVWNQSHTGLKPVPCYPEISLRVVWNQSHAILKSVWGCSENSPMLFWNQFEADLKPVPCWSETNLMLVWNQSHTGLKPAPCCLKSVWCWS